MSQTFEIKLLEQALCDHLRAHVLAPNVVFTANMEFDALDIDSVTVVELVMLLEDQFNISIPIHLLKPEHMRSVQSLVACAVTHGMPLR